MKYWTSICKEAEETLLDTETGMEKSWPRRLQTTGTWGGKSSVVLELSGTGEEVQRLLDVNWQGDRGITIESQEQE